MPMLIFEAIGPKGEELAMAAGNATGIPVGWDDEYSSATFDSDTHGEDEFETVIAEALDDIDADWRSHLRAVD
jgi:hypothetical protein